MFSWIQNFLKQNIGARATTRFIPTILKHMLENARTIVCMRANPPAISEYMTCDLLKVIMCDGTPCRRQHGLTVVSTRLATFGAPAFNAHFQHIGHAHPRDRHLPSYIVATTTNWQLSRCSRTAGHRENCDFVVVATAWYSKCLSW